MRAQIVALGGLSIALVAGLVIWWTVDRDRTVPDADLLAALADHPPIGEPLAPVDPRAPAIRAALGDERANVVRLLRRADTDVLGVVVAGRDASDALSALRTLPGVVPVVLGNGRSVEVLLRDANVALTPPAGVVARARAHAVPRETDDGEAPTTAGASGEPEPDEERDPAFVDPGLGLPWPEVAIGLFPVLDPPSPSAPMAWLAFGNYRGCPDASVHVAILDHLASEHGARLIAITGESITLELGALPDPAARRDVAAILAAYAPSVRDRGDGTRRSIEALAATLESPRAWRLRWPRPR